MKPTSNVEKIKLKSENAVRLVRQIAANSAQIRFTLHAQERMVERDIFIDDVRYALLEGRIKNEPKLDAKSGGWVITMVCDKGNTNREIGVVTLVLIRDQKLKIITVEWEDLK